ncbi:Ig-like domain-containing protein [uncultured Cytophaga sp.]|uniref:Ig-like domain-containing protein n=1 Tax=uncultured Cytophaga sp. TaxID=160238 RepID=UPI002621A57E|nr:Ig-like domain-containing protein [uncultured Cytophaga sp.]
MIRILILLFSSVLFVRCANIVPPTGGPRDMIPPKLVSEFPKNGATNYKEKYISLTFDEPIVDNQLSSKLIVSPTIEGSYIVRIKKNTVKLSWSDTLKENTTYTFNFADGIKDNTESNTINNYSVTFSTGNDIDSNKIEAKINNVPGQMASNNLKLFLYPKTDTILKLLKIKPEYIGHASDSGKVKIKYIKENSYTSIAVIDLNKNNKWDINEAVDVKNITIKNIVNESYQLQFTTLDTTKIVSINNKLKTINILTNKGLQEIKISDSYGTYIPTKINSRKYTIENQYKLEDSTKIQIEYVDSMGIKGAFSKNIIFKNIDLQRFKDTTINISNTNKKYKLKPKLDSIQYSVDRLIDTIQLTLKAPEYVSYEIKNYNNSFTIIFKGQKEKDSIEFTLPYKTILSLYGEFNQKYTQQLVVDEQINYGNLQFEIKTDLKNYASYLEDNSKNIVYSSSNKSINKIKNLDAGIYKLYVIVDTNNNGYWDAYDPINNIPAEPVYYFKEPIQIRANWDLEDIQMIF